LNELSIDILLCGCVETCGVYASIASITPREFCGLVEKHLKPLVIEK